MSRFALRPMKEGDLDRVMALAETLPQAPHWTRSAYIAAIDPVASPHRLALVAEDWEGIVGFVVVALLPPEAELETIAIRHARQRQGIARLLFDELQKELKDAGVTEVILEVRVSNQAARGLYGALGFKETGVRPRYYADPVEDALLLRLEI